MFIQRDLEIRIIDIPEGGQQVETEIDIVSVENLLEGAIEVSRVLTPLSLKCDFVRTGTEIILDGTYRVDLELNCIKCLDNFTYGLDEGFHYIYRTVFEKAEPEDQELKSNDLEIYYCDGENIDLSSIVREQIYLNLPQYPYCNEDCLGLCVYCGENLKKGLCKCLSGKTRANSPFCVLEKLKDDK